MKEAGGIVAISTPFVAGIAVAEVFSQSLARYTPLFLILSAGFLAAAVLIKGRARTALAAALFFSGLFTLLSRHIAVSIPLNLHFLNTQWLKSAIHAIPFQHENTAPLLTALLCGDRSGLPEVAVKAFRAAGAAHILALSGLHLGVIYAVIVRCFSAFGGERKIRTARCVITILLCGAYAAMTGAGPSIVRAFLFITLREMLLLSPHRRMRSIDVLCATLLIQLVISPEVIASIGFQLSYLAMAGIFLLLPVLESWYPSGPHDRFNPVRRMWTMMALSISCQVFTGPLVWLRFHTFPRHFLLTNLLAMPLTELLIISAVALLCLSPLGVQPHFLVAATDFLCEFLQKCLSIIAEI